MVAKKSTKTTPEESAPVDMNRIEAMMGPLPEERKDPPRKHDKKTDEPKVTAEPSTAPTVKGANKDVSAAAEEANASLKALGTTMGEATITKVDDEPITPENTEVYLSALETHADKEQPIEGEGVAADDPGVVAAVNDIVAKEGDKLLEAEDEKLESINEPAQRTGFKAKFKALWAKPAVRWLVLIIMLLLIAAAALVPSSRYYALNLAGVRASVNVTVIDSGTLQPLKNVAVTAAGVTAQTDAAGKARLEHVKLGTAKLQITKRAFTAITRDITVGWGSNKQGQFRLAASGAQYSFIVTDFLSGKPIEKAEASSGEGSAQSDKDGKIVLTLDTSGKNDTDELDIKISAANYRDETLKITAGNKETSAAKMVPARKSVFVSKRSGKYDVYTIDIDGKNEKKIVSGTGIERDDMALVPQQNSDQAALVATRENARNNEGYLLSTLYLLDTKTGNLNKIDQSEQIQIIGWASDGSLVYVKIAAGASAANPKRHRLISLNTKNNSALKELAAANSFNDIIMASDKVLYAPSNALNDNPKPGLFSVNASGASLVTVTDKEILNIFRTDYDTVGLSASGANYIYKIGAAPSSLAATSSLSTTNRLYIDSATTGKSIWLDDRDGKGVLLSYDKNTKKDIALTSKSGLQLPAYWLNDTNVIYRVNDGKETADYVVSVNGGEAKKILDVTNTTGVGRWYYY